MIPDVAKCIHCGGQHQGEDLQRRGMECVLRQLCDARQEINRLRTLLQEQPIEADEPIEVFA